ncbi:MAG: cobaltochelatase subunit CobN [Deltaproteobacteria bacterium]|nr:cobaltochelatase subunit CobN [Deltaproteobacteria bacterium]
MPQLDLVYFSTTSNDLPNLIQAAKSLREQGVNIALRAFTKPQLLSEEDKRKFVAKALQANAVVVTLMGGESSCPVWDQLLVALGEARRAGDAPYFHVQPTGANQEAWQAAVDHADGLDGGSWQDLNAYYRHGGRGNAEQLLRLLCNAATGASLPLLPPEVPPTEGVYHPDWPGSPPLEDYLASLDPAKPLIGIWFYQNLWVNRAVKHIDALIHEVEAQGGEALAVFHYRFMDQVVGNLGADEVAERFFRRDGKTIIDALLSPMMFSLGMASEKYHGILKHLDVPVIQAVSTMQPVEQWRESMQGLSAMDVTMSLAQPEFDGNLISAPVASKQETRRDPISGAALAEYLPIPDRVAQAVSLTLNWAALRRKPNSEKRVAIVFHHYPPRNDRIGCAAGLDSFASVQDLLRRMAEGGYRLEDTFQGEDVLAHALLAGMTGDRRWLPPEEMARRAAATVGSTHFHPWHEALPEAVQAKMVADWGSMPGELFTHDGKLLVPGLVTGNVFISMQPPRGFLEQADKIYHDPHLSPPHHYLAFYRWIKYVFKADVVLHIGKHGSLEWLPGKGTGLSRECYPELAIMDLPNVYPYIINDPGEGTQAKRRSAACIIDHMTPVMVNADLYEDLAQVDNLIKEYNEARVEDPGKLEILRPMLWNAVEKADLQRDLEMDQEQALADFEAFLEKLHAYLGEMADTLINDGLHIMGRPPQGQALTDCLAQLTRLANGEAPSLRQAVLAAQGHDYDFVLEKRGQVLSPGGLTGGQVIAQAQEQCLELLRAMAERDYQPEAAEAVTETVLGKNHPAVAEALRYAVQEVLPRLLAITEETDACLAAMDGRHVAPGPSGAPSRGQVEVLPTGRNFFSVDPQKIPTPAAWKVGKALGEAMLERHLKDHGRYPENIGFILWASPTMRNKGDDVAEILWLMGLKPMWQQGSGNVRGLAVIPLSELGRPRLDVTPRMSGIFRDAFPTVVELLDKGVRMAAALQEDTAMNYLRAHVVNDSALYRQEGLDDEQAFRRATLRLFGAPPGAYGAGVAALMEAKNWKDIHDIGDVFVGWSSYAYGQGVNGIKQESAYRRLLGRMDVTVKNEDSREYDMMSCTDFYSYHGGLIAAVRSVRGQAPESFAGDSSDPERVKVRTAAEEAKHVFRSRLLNPKWVRGLMRHGYKGAGDVSKAVDVAFGWDATADVVDDFMYERLAQRVAFDPEVRRWMEQVNPSALHNIAEKLLEAIGRGMWQAEEETHQRLLDLYLQTEGEVEQAMDPEQDGARS